MDTVPVPHSPPPLQITSWVILLFFPISISVRPSFPSHICLHRSSCQELWCLKYVDRGQCWSFSCVKGLQIGGNPKNSMPPLKQATLTGCNLLPWKSEVAYFIPCSKGRLTKGLDSSPGTPSWQLTPGSAYKQHPATTSACCPGFMNCLPPHGYCSSLSNPVPTCLAVLLWLPYHVLALFLWFRDFSGFGCPPTCVWPLFCFDVLTDYPISYR